eukprot:1298497-Ditylum_brightwellii.AAC.1
MRQWIIKGGSVFVVKYDRKGWKAPSTTSKCMQMQSINGGGAPEDVKNLLSHISSLFNDEVNNPSLHGTLTTFNSIGWKK